MIKLNKIKMWLAIFLLAIASAIIFIFIILLPKEVSKSNVYPLAKEIDFSYKWLKTSSCLAPCWEDIVPGQTNADQAMNLLQQNVLVKDVVKVESARDYGLITWSWRDNSSKNGGEIRYNFAPPKIVFSIRPFYSSSFKLGDIISKYGLPDKVLAFRTINADGPSTYTVALSFSKYNFTIQSFELDSLDAEISSNLVMYLPEFSVLKRVDMQAIDTKAAIAWQGFKQFRYYCRDKYDSNKLC